VSSQIRRLKKFMDGLYPGKRHRRRLPAIDELILTILSQNTSDINSGRAYDALKEKYPAWADVASADVRGIASAIRPGGLAPQKAPRIKAILKEIFAERGKYDIEHVRKMSLGEGIEYLTSFKGVGVKTASCVLLFSAGIPAFPVDTHILRVSKRLGIVGVKDNADKASGVYLRHTRPEDRFKFHIDIIHFGREICHPRNPECPICRLSNHCLYFNNKL
jgi:endonuclease-3